MLDFELHEASTLSRHSHCRAEKAVLCVCALVCLSAVLYPALQTGLKCGFSLVSDVVLSLDPLPCVLYAELLHDRSPHTSAI